MASTWINTAVRTLIVLLVGLAAILAFAIYVATHSSARTRAEAEQADASVAEAKTAEDEARTTYIKRRQALEDENANLHDQLEEAKKKFDGQSTKLAAAEKEALRLRGELDKALKQVVELGQKCADLRLKQAEDLKREIRETERPAGLHDDAVKKDPVPRPAGPRNDAAKKESAPEGNTDIARAAKKRFSKDVTIPKTKRGAVSPPSLPRTSPSFSELDTDHDGRLTLEEYKVGFPDNPDVEKEFKSLDTDGDGKLSIDEYKAGHPDPGVVRWKRQKKN